MKSNDRRAPTRTEVDTPSVRGKSKLLKLRILTGRKGLVREEEIDLSVCVRDIVWHSL